MSSALKGAAEDNVLAMLCWSEQHCATIASSVTADLFSSRTYQKVAKVAIDYIMRFGHPPQDHVPDLLERDMRGDEGKLLTNSLILIKKLFPTLHADYVLEELDKFVRIRQTMMRMDGAYDALMNGDEEKAEELLWSGKTHTDTLSIGTWLHDEDMGFITEKEEEFFSTGVEELDNRGIRPERGTAIMFIAPKKWGKSLFCVAVGKANLQRRKSVLHVTLENSERLTKRRYVQAFFAYTKREAQEVRLPSFTFETEIKRDKDGEIIYDRASSWTGTKIKMFKSRGLVAENEAHIVRDIRTLRTRPRLLIKGFPSGTLTIAKLNAYLDRIEREQHFKPDLLIVDYPDLMKVSRGESFRLDLGGIFIDLRGVLGERNMAGFFPTQGNRQSDDARWVTSKMVAEDWSKTGTADIILTGNRTKQEKKRGLARILVDAARDEEDSFSVMITQAYAIGQFCTDSVFMAGHVSVYNEQMNSGVEMDDDGEEVDEEKHGSVIERH